MKLSRHFQIHSEYVLMYTAGNGLKHAPKCTRWHTPSVLDLRSQVRSQDAPMYTPSTSSNTLPGMLSRTLPIALGGTLPACLPIRSQVSSQDAPKYTPSTSASTLPGMLSRMLPIALGGTVPTCSTVRSQLLSMAHSQPA